MYAANESMKLNASLVALTVILSLSLVQAVGAQSASTSISNLKFPSRASTGADIPVTFTVTYSKGSKGYVLVIAIFGQNNGVNAYIPQGTAVASPIDCNGGESSLGGTLYNKGVCGLAPLQDSGSESVRFDLVFQAPKVYNLVVSVGFMDSNDKDVSSADSTSSVFSISVT